ncbi:hypothetical protein BDV11DRAFT_167208 [Aspergillus similis]
MPPRALLAPPTRPLQPPAPSQARKKRPAQEALDEDDTASGILCRVPCLRCAKQSWVLGPGDEPVGPLLCRRTRAGAKCLRCTRLHKTCDLIPGPYEQEIVKIRGRLGDDTDRVADTVNWTRRVETFLRKANKEPEMLRLMHSLLRHTFELRNDLRAAHRHAPLLPPSAETVWPIMDGTETDDQLEERAAAAEPRGFAGFGGFGDQDDAYGLSLFP